MRDGGGEKGESMTGVRGERKGEIQKWEEGNRRKGVRKKNEKAEV